MPFSLHAFLLSFKHMVTTLSCGWTDETTLPLAHLPMLTGRPFLRHLPSGHQMNRTKWDVWDWWTTRSGAICTVVMIMDLFVSDRHEYTVSSASIKFTFMSSKWICFYFGCKTVLDVTSLNVNYTNGKAEVDVTSLLLMIFVTFSHNLSRSTNHIRRYMVNRIIPKKLRSSSNEHQ